MTSAPFRRRPDILWRRSLDAIVLLPAGAEEPITLAGTGVAVWDLIDTWRTVEALTELLATEYHADRGTVAADLEVLVAELRDQNVVEIGAESGGPGAG